MHRSKTSLTIRDVAEACGVSVSTVSRVLNDKDDVAPETYEKVRRVIAELGYSSSLAATSMRSRRTNVIGVLVISLGDPFSLELFKGIGRAVHGTEYDLFVYSSGPTAANMQPGWERRHLSRLDGSIADGLLVVTPTTEDLSSISPLVAVDPHEHNVFPAVISTNREGAIAVMEYLLDLGHRRIGFITGRKGLLSASRRQQGYLEALERAGVPLDPDLIQEGDYSRERGFSCAQQLFGLPDPPTAIFAANDQSALGVMDAAREAGLRVPEDISVVGFDNIPQAAGCVPGLTTVDQFVSEMGYIATTMLIKLMRGETLEEPLRRIPTRLIIRDSCRAIQR
ncbi:MAG TPA: LacI family DNA-binding transcriptional regulator [Anaerolineae bacterium]|nr:LacI family DNA-binding transcriptional regulator [Anaerolineae bacterium]HQK14743.1 LacI family DNA-binding transcriptional regulator [Anaerolineae bacterium]